MDTNYYENLNGENEARAAVMAPVLWKVFWMVVISNVISLLSFIPATVRFATLFGYVAAFLVGMLIMTLQTVDSRFRTAGRYAVASAVMLLVGMLLGSNATMPLTLAASVCSLFAMFFELNTLSLIVAQADANLGKRWRDLWKFRMIALCCSMGCTLLVLLAPGLASLLLVAVAVAAWILSLMQMVYYYKTAKLYDGMIAQ